ncbi:Zn-dependent protease with chaperone function [Saccharopolyspora antimicrobica]|uniref:Zn-dependent protease with chaperone function n=1 Tax=Saccharopolyspora antimicrobica TaxID=455193 RepID=A0A1I5IZZ8_9PSEU|nr:M48 family metallopeptidase [Saccharopolyspora antimicrobica]RKT83800.1 Zn-dependent protease with chaperone function [Saccharopolyspora antimicrobica]SFO65701.1 Zn-dependent protease with chaperone function [Saccharopolyspora antimicrobica]
MRGPWRAALALALHIAFFVAPIALVLGLLSIAVVTFRYDRTSGLKAAAAALVVGALFAVGLRAVLRSRVRARGVLLDRSEQPQLWRMANSIAASAEAPEPDEIRITSEPVVVVREDTALLGLRTRTRYLELGLPLLAALNVSELRAAMAREIGRLTGRNRLTVLAYRTSASVERTAAGLTGGPTKWLFNGYARAFTAVAATTAQDLELAADAVAVREAGTRTAVLALRKVVAVEIGWREYAEEYLSMATAIGHAPDVLVGFRNFMAHPARKPRLAERAKQTIAEEPRTRRRIEAMKRIKTGDREVDERPAFAVLKNPRKSVPALEERLLVDGLDQRLPWPELAQRAGAAHVAEQAALLSSAVEQSGLPIEPSIAGVLAAIHRGQGRDLINPVLNPGLSPELIDQAAEDTLVDLLGCVVVDALVCARRAHHELDWGGPPPVRLANGQPLDADRLVRPAVVDPRLIPGLHRALVNLGVPLNHARRPAAEPEPELAGIVSPVQCAGSSYDLLVTDRGLVLLPSSASTTKRLLAGTLARFREAELEQLGELAATPVGELRERSGAQWVDSRDVASARLDQDRAGWSLSLELYLDEYAVSDLDDGLVRGDEDGASELVLRSSADGVEHGDPYRGLGELMGARMNVEEPIAAIE